MADKLDMKSMNMTQENIKKIRTLFPNAVKEIIKDGEICLAVDFDVLNKKCRIFLLMISKNVIK